MIKWTKEQVNFSCISAFYKLCSWCAHIYLHTSFKYYKSCFKLGLRQRSVRTSAEHSGKGFRLPLSGAWVWIPDNHGCQHLPPLLSFFASLFKALSLSASFGCAWGTEQSKISVNIDRAKPYLFRFLTI